jgi:hypothetical protein
VHHCSFLILLEAYTRSQNCQDIYQRILVKDRDRGKLLHSRRCLESWKNKRSHPHRHPKRKRTGERYLPEQADKRASWTPYLVYTILIEKSNFKNVAFTVLFDHCIQAEGEASRTQRVTLDQTYKRSTGFCLPWL